MIEREWLIDWVQDRSQNVEVTADINLLYSNTIDSFGFIELIEEIERVFNVQFAEDDFMNQDAFTIDALSALIMEKRR